MKCCGHFLIKVEGGARNYKRDIPLPLARQFFTVKFVQRKGYIHTYQKSQLNTNMTELARITRSLTRNVLGKHKWRAS